MKSAVFHSLMGAREIAAAKSRAAKRIPREMTDAEVDGWSDGLDVCPDPLDNLIRKVGLLLGDCGILPPRSLRDALIDVFCLPEDAVFETPADVVVQGIGRILEAVNDGSRLAQMTYGYLLEARENRERGNHASALSNTAHAADTLARAIAALSRQPQKRGAIERLRKNPQQSAKQTAKIEAFKLWQDRRAGRHPELRTNEQFATECMRRWPALTSAKVILGWCTDWNKAAKARKPQSAS